MTTIRTLLTGNAYDIANIIVSRYSNLTKVYKLARTFLDEYQEAGEAIGDDTNPFNPNIGIAEELEENFLNNLKEDYMNLPLPAENVKPVLLSREKKIEIFMQVIKNNCDMLTNMTISRGQEKVVLEYSTQGQTEDELRDQAVDFFYYQLSKTLTEKLKNNL